MVQVCFQKSRIFGWVDWQSDQGNIKQFQEFQKQAVYRNVKAEDSLDMGTETEAEADVKETDKFIDNHQQSKEDEEGGTLQEHLEWILRICFK